MTSGSLRFRLLAAATVSLLLALALASFGLVALFERHVERRFAAELGAAVNQIVGSIAVAANGGIVVQGPPRDPRFSEPLGGRYWQVSENNHVIAASRSLWDSELTLPADDLRDGEVHQHMISGPGGSTLFAVERAISLPASLGGHSLRIVVAVDHAEITSARNAFGRDLLPYVTVLGLFLLAASWAQVTIGLRPMKDVRERLAEVRAGRRAMLGPGFPDEVRPLANEVDLLLEMQAAAIIRARAHAADLAHGLRTPLTVLQTDAEELKTLGQQALGEEIADLAQTMRRHVDRELARARAGSRTSRQPAASLSACVQGVVGVVRRLPSAADLNIEIDVPEGMTLAMDPQDLAEVLGNLIENAAKWARSEIRVSARGDGRSGTIFIEDDGPGISESETGQALTRGGRLDEHRSGTGLGLSIVQDILENYRGSLKLSRSGLGGLKAEVHLDRMPPV